MHRGNKISFLVVLFFLQIGDTLLTSHTTRLVARVPLVMIGCSTVAGISKRLKGNNSVDRIPSGGAPLPRSARSSRACGQLAAASARCCRGASAAAAAAAERAGSACRHAEDPGVRHRRLGPQLHIGSYPAPRGRRPWELAPVGRAALPSGERVHPAASNDERLRVAGEELRGG
ncbi:hypothetical protein PVAP13_6KG208612 [Panicum virgatum]|uniref:Uncharacterized protein n=1 Tax=Panicum virgatum TaxID=38727 RepID=A0A8T0REZ0_PANVG|nr:hypothetical protein PVAP13_6KG208612 [Panicum virgatum]